MQPVALEHEAGAGAARRVAAHAAPATRVGASGSAGPTPSGRPCGSPCSVPRRRRAPCRALRWLSSRRPGHTAPFTFPQGARFCRSSTSLTRPAEPPARAASRTSRGGRRTATPRWTTRHCSFAGSSPRRRRRARRDPARRARQGLRRQPPRSRAEGLQPQRPHARRALEKRRREAVLRSAQRRLRRPADAGAGDDQPAARRRRRGALAGRPRSTRPTR